MTDTEKIHVIDSIISDFWGYHSDDEVKNYSPAIVTAISAVIGFKEDEPDGQHS